MNEAVEGKASGLIASVLQIKNTSASILPEIGQLTQLADVSLVSSSDKTSIRCAHSLALKGRTHKNYF
jgi:hypothetical protein